MKLPSSVFYLPHPPNPRYNPRARDRSLFSPTPLGRKTRKVKPKTGSSFHQEPRIRLDEPQGSRNPGEACMQGWGSYEDRGNHASDEGGESTFRTRCILYISEDREMPCHNIWMEREICKV